MGSVRKRNRIICLSNYLSFITIKRVNLILSHQPSQKKEQGTEFKAKNMSKLSLKLYTEVQSPKKEQF